MMWSKMWFFANNIQHQTRDCRNSSAHMIHEYIDHACVKHLSRRNDFQAPDLCILMNGYTANHETALWSETIRLFLERAVPSLFTANDACMPGEIATFYAA
ncbi:hypothetical protein R3P38DRAFT_2813900 [Favolaschia claudopus]|uniref:Uncharacterized protein n=1 Tax=Favolaschia claudopus TaxID=2862362 RepID=A0AAV9Z487_9AGAR